MQGGRENRACDTVNTAHEQRRGYHAQIREVGERKNPMIDNEPLEHCDVLLAFLQKRVPAHMLAADSLQDFPYDGVDVTVALEVCV